MLAVSPETNLLEVDEIFRDAGSPVYLIAKPELTIRDRHARLAQRARLPLHVAA